MRNSNHPRAALQSWTAAVVLAMLMLCVFSCGEDSPAGPVLGNDPPSPGEGTGTLLVTAEVQGRSVNGSVSETEFLATVSDTLGAPVSGSVTVTGRFGNLQLEEGAPGSYSAVRSGYDTGSYTLNVTSGPDKVTGVTVLAPDIHVITTPTANQVVESNTALNVRWTRPESASECRLETRDYDSDWIFGDTGTLWVPSVGNPPRVDQRIGIERRNYQIPQGALPLSRFSVGIRCAVEPIIAQ